MATLQLLLFIAAGICILSWLLFSFRAAYHGMSIAQLGDQAFDDASEFSKLSVVVTARNEERMMAQDLESLLGVDYPDIEFIVIDDRSTDKTGEIIDRYAAQDVRIKALHIDSLPSGWLGKVHALNIGAQTAQGKWLLFTDADIRFEKETLKRSLYYSEQNHLDHLCLLPDDRSQGDKLLVPLFVLAFGAMFVERTQVRNIGEEGSEAFIGVGAFNLVRREAYEKTPGFEWLKMEVIDDVGLGWMLNQYGARSAVLNAQGLLSFEWYHSLKEAIKGLEKNAFAGFAGYSYLRGILLVLLMWAIVLLPIIVAAVYQSLVLVLAVIFLYYGIPFVVGVMMKKRLKIKPILVALIPIGYLFVSVAIAGSILSVWRHKGIRWRDTFYSLKELRNGRRVKL